MKMSASSKIGNWIGLLVHVRIASSSFGKTNNVLASLLHVITVATGDDKEDFCPDGDS